MKKYSLNIFAFCCLFLTFFCESSLFAQQQYILEEYFEKNTANVSGVTTKKLTSGDWSFYYVDKGYNSNPVACALLKYSGSNMGYIIMPSLNQPGVLTFNARTQGNVSNYLNIQKSVDGGATYTSIGQVQISGTTYTQYSIDINETGSNVKIKFLRTKPSSDGSNYNIIVDDVKITKAVVVPILGVFDNGNIINCNSSQPVSFGTVQGTATYIDKIFTLSNTGNAPLSISQIHFDKPSFALMGSLPLSVAVGATTNITVRFTPTEVGVTDGTMQIVNNASPCTINLRGEYVAPIVQNCEPVGCNLIPNGNFETINNNASPNNMVCGWDVNENSVYQTETNSYLDLYSGGSSVVTTTVNVTSGTYLFGANIKTDSGILAQIYLESSSTGMTQQLFNRDGVECDWAWFTKTVTISGNYNKLVVKQVGNSGDFYIDDILLKRIDCGSSNDCNLFPSPGYRGQLDSGIEEFAVQFNSGKNYSLQFKTRTTTAYSSLPVQARIYLASSANPSDKMLVYSKDFHAPMHPDWFDITIPFIKPDKNYDLIQFQNVELDCSFYFKEVVIEDYTCSQPSNVSTDECNLVLNGDFDIISGRGSISHGQIYNWYPIGIDGNITIKDGENVLQISRYGVFTPVDVKQGQNYTLQFSLGVEDMNTGFNVYFKNSLTGQTQTVYQFIHDASMHIVSVPVKNLSADFDMLCFGIDRSDAYIDKVKLMQETCTVDDLPTGCNVVTNGDFEKDDYGWFITTFGSGNNTDKTVKYFLSTEENLNKYICLYDEFTMGTSINPLSLNKNYKLSLDIDKKFDGGRIWIGGPPELIITLVSSKTGNIKQILKEDFEFNSSNQPTWHRIEIDIIADDEYDLLYIRNYFEHAGYYIDNVFMEESGCTPIDDTECQPTEACNMIANSDFSVGDGNQICGWTTSQEDDSSVTISNIFNSEKVLYVENGIAYTSVNVTPGEYALSFNADIEPSGATDVKIYLESSTTGAKQILFECNDVKLTWSTNNAPYINIPSITVSDNYDRLVIQENGYGVGIEIDNIVFKQADCERDCQVFAHSQEFYLDDGAKEFPVFLVQDRNYSLKLKTNAHNGSEKARIYLTFDSDRNNKQLIYSKDFSAPTDWEEISINFRANNYYDIIVFEEAYGDCELRFKDIVIEDENCLPPVVSTDECKLVLNGDFENDAVGGRVFDRQVSHWYPVTENNAEPDVRIASDEVLGKYLYFETGGIYTNIQVEQGETYRLAYSLEVIQQSNLKVYLVSDDNSQRQLIYEENEDERNWHVVSTPEFTATSNFSKLQFEIAPTATSRYTEINLDNISLFKSDCPVSFGCQPAGDCNIIANGDFEINNEDGFPCGWDATWKWLGIPTPSLNKAFKFTEPDFFKQTDNNKYVFLTDETFIYSKVNLTKGKTYDLSFDHEVSAYDDYNTLIVYLISSQRRDTIYHKVTPRMGRVEQNASRNWTKIEVRNIPINYDYDYLVIAEPYEHGGGVYIDNIHMEESGCTPPAIVSSCACDFSDTPENLGFTKIPRTENTGLDDGSWSKPLDLKFPFKLFGTTYMQAYVNNNGNITFNNPNGTYVTSGLGTSGMPAMIAPYWSDIDLSGDENMNMYYKYEKNNPQNPSEITTVKVLWHNVGYFPSQGDKRATIQLSLTNGNDKNFPQGTNVIFCYDKLEFTTGSASCRLGDAQTRCDNSYPTYYCDIGGGFGGTPATVGVTLGDGKNFYQIGRFDHKDEAGTEPFKGPLYEKDPARDCYEYDAVNWLLEMSKECALGFDFSEVYNVNAEPVCNPATNTYKFSVNLFTGGYPAGSNMMYLEYDGQRIASNPITWLLLRSFQRTFEFPADGKQHTVRFRFAGSPTVYTKTITAPQPCSFPENDIDCSDECIASFAPVPGERYVLSGWVKEAQSTASSYKNAYVELFFKGANVTSEPIFAQGAIIDSWQRINHVFTIPADAQTIEVRLKSGNADAYFDDIRIHPFGASMKSYVYDPVTLKLTAILDEQNYATFYEYDEEGLLIRVKKETARGIKTIQESFSHTRKSK